MSGIEAYLGTTDGMECLRNNSAQDDGTDSVNGVEWFKFNGVTASMIFVSGNMWMGFGMAFEQLKPYRRDGKMWYLYRQEGMINNVRFLKIRWEGYTQYSGNSDDCRLIYEHFIFDDGSMFLNVVQAPTSASYLGNSELSCGSNTYKMNLGTNDTCPIRYLFTPDDAEGMSWTLEAGVLPSFSTERYLLRRDGTLYACDGTQLEGATLNAALFQSEGSDAAPASDVLAALVGCEVLKWSDSETTPRFAVNTIGTVALPKRIMLNVDVSDSTIHGIQGAEVDYDGDVRVQTSIDRGARWSDEVALSELANIDADALWESLQEDKMLTLKVLLYEGGIVRRIKFRFINN